MRRRRRTVRGRPALVLTTVLVSVIAVGVAPSAGVRAATLPTPVRPGAVQYPKLGVSVGVDGDVAVAGAPDGNFPHGTAYIYHFTGRSWHKQILVNPDTADTYFFGEAVAVSGTTVLVGADTDFTSVPKVFVYTLAGQSWKLAGTIAQPHPVDGQAFGVGLAIDGTTAVIGDTQGDDNRGIGYVFTGHGGSWRFQGRLTDPAGISKLPGEQLGLLVAVSASTAALGGVYQTGLVFARHGTKWFRQASFGHLRNESNVYYSAVALSGNTLAYSQPGWNNATGVVYIYTRIGRTWKRTARLFSPHPVKSGYFGSAVALSGSRLVVGASNLGLARCGTAFEFTESRGKWHEREEIANPGCRKGDAFGLTIALSGRTAVIGAPYKDNYKGAVYVETVL